MLQEGDGLEHGVQIHQLDVHRARSRVRAARARVARGNLTATVCERKVDSIYTGGNLPLNVAIRFAWRAHGLAMGGEHETSNEPWVT